MSKVMKIGSLTVSGTNRNLKINYTKKGKPYFVLNNRRYLIEDFLTLTVDSITYGCKAMSNCFALMILLDDRNQTVKAYWS